MGWNDKLWDGMIWDGMIWDGMGRDEVLPVVWGKSLGDFSLKVWVSNWVCNLPGIDGS